MSSLPCVAACCSVMQYVAVCFSAGVSEFDMQRLFCRMMRCVDEVTCHVQPSLCCRMLQCYTLCCRVLQCVSVQT